MEWQWESQNKIWEKRVGIAERLVALWLEGTVPGWPRARARPAHAYAELYRHATCRCRRTSGCSFGCGRAGHPRPLTTGVVGQRWHEQTRSAARGAEKGGAPCQDLSPGAPTACPIWAGTRSLLRVPCLVLALQCKPWGRPKPNACLRACPAHACVGHWCVRALHLLARALPSSARVRWSTFSRNAQCGEFLNPMNSSGSAW